MMARKQQTVRKLHLACGPHIIEGWDNIDILEGKNIIHHDLREPLPYKDESVDGIFHEHFIEHLTKVEAERFLKDCYRVLKPGAAMRLGWPDMKKLINAYLLHNKKYQDYVQPHLDDHRFGKDWDEMFSDCLFSWEHVYAYTAKHLTKVLEAAGFKNVTVMRPGKSKYDLALDFRRDPATTYLEATK